MLLVIQRARISKKDVNVDITIQLAAGWEGPKHHKTQRTSDQQIDWNVIRRMSDGTNV